MSAETIGEVVWKRNDSASDHEVWDDTALIQAYDRAVNQVKDEISIKNTGAPNTKKKGKNRKAKGNQITWKVGDYCRAVFSEDGLHYEAYIKEINQNESSCLVQYLGYGNEEIVAIADLSPSLGKDTRAHQEENASHKTWSDTRNESASETNSQQPLRQNRSTSKHKRNWRHGSRSFQGCQAHNEPATSMPGPPGGLLSWLKTIVPPQTSSDLKSQSYSCGCVYSGNSFQPHQGSPLDPLYQHQVPHHIPPPPPFPLDRDVIDNEEALAAMLMSWYMSGYHTGFYQALQQTRSSKHGTGPCCSHTLK